MEIFKKKYQNFFQRIHEYIVILKMRLPIHKLHPEILSFQHTHSEHLFHIELSETRINNYASLSRLKQMLFQQDEYGTKMANDIRNILNLLPTLISKIIE